MLDSETNFFVHAWAGWYDGGSEMETKSLPSLLRRRVTPLGRQALGAAWAISDAENARYVFSSRHGEFGRTLSILKNIAESEPLSPADFSLSVHHALIGLLSIEQKNHQGHTALAAGAESFCLGLMEAVACLIENPNVPVVLVHCDEPLPENYAVFNAPEEAPCALALLLKANGGEKFSFQSFSNEGHKGATLIARDFLNFLNSKNAQADSFSEKYRWHWIRHGVG